MRFVLVGGATRTAAIEGISAAGAEPELMAHTPSADAEILEYGTTVRSPVVPVSPTGCPTPAVVSRAVREAMGFPVTTIDAGMAEPTGAPVVEIGADPGGDLRNAVPVPETADLLSSARRFGASLPDDHIYIGETIPGGTTTALGTLAALGERPSVSFTTIDAGMAEPTGAPVVEIGADPGGDLRNAVPVPETADLLSGARRFGTSLPDDHIYIGETIPGGTTTALGTLAALGERPSVSSSLPENPTALKTDVVDAGLSASGISPGSATGDPVGAIRTMGDPVLPVVAGLALGAIEAGTEVTLAGGTQLLAAAALIRHAGIDRPITVATTSFVAEDESAEVAELAADLDVDLRVTDPGFDGTEHPAMAAFARGEAKEGVGMGGLLAAAADASVQEEQIHERIRAVYDRFQSES